MCGEVNLTGLTVHAGLWLVVCQAEPYKNVAGRGTEGMRCGEEGGRQYWERQLECRKGHLGDKDSRHFLESIRMTLAKTSSKSGYEA